MDDYQDPEDVPGPAGATRSRDGTPKRTGVDDREREAGSGPDASEAPEEEGSVSPG